MLLEQALVEWIDRQAVLLGETRGMSGRRGTDRYRVRRRDAGAHGFPFFFFFFCFSQRDHRKIRHEMAESLLLLGRNVEIWTSEYHILIFFPQLGAEPVKRVAASKDKTVPKMQGAEMQMVQDSRRS